MSNPNARDGQAVPASYKTSAVLLICTVKPGQKVDSDRGKKKSTHHNDHVSFTISYCLHIHRIVIDIQSHSVIASVSISGEAP